MIYVNISDLTHILQDCSSVQWYNPEILGINYVNVYGKFIIKHETKQNHANVPNGIQQI